MPSPLVARILDAPWSRRDYPKILPSLALWLDAQDPLTFYKTDGSRAGNGDAVALWADKSGNSATNCLVLNGVAGNYGSFTALTAFGTGDFSVSIKASAATLAAANSLLGGATNAFSLKLTTTGAVQTAKVGVLALTASTGTVVAFQEAVLGYTRSGTTGTYYINGVAAGTVTDNLDYTVGLTELGSVASGTQSVLTGLMKWARVYTAALTSPEMLADAGGTVQANCSFNEDFSTAAKLAPSVTASTGQTVTINSTGATGARISGARDLYQGTAANQPILTIAATGNYLTFDGSNDYLKAAAFSLAQPTTVYWAGQSISWALLDDIFDGNADATMQLRQSTSTPTLGIYAGTTVIENSGLAVGTNGIVSSVFNGASSSVRVNRTAAVTGNAGPLAANGFTLGAQGAGTNRWSNITASSVLLYAAAHEQPQQDNLIRWLGRLCNIVV